MKLNNLELMSQGLEKIALALSSTYEENIIPEDVLLYLSELMFAEDFDDVARYIKSEGDEQ